MAGGISFSTMADPTGKLPTTVKSIDDTLNTNLEDFDPANADAADMLALQMQMQEWTMAIQLQSNAMKSVGDGLKSVVGNLR